MQILSIMQRFGGSGDRFGDQQRTKRSLGWSENGQNSRGMFLREAEFYSVDVFSARFGDMAVDRMGMETSCAVAEPSCGIGVSMPLAIFSSWW